MNKKTVKKTVKKTTARTVKYPSGFERKTIMFKDLREGTFFLLNDRLCQKIDNYDQIALQIGTDVIDDDLCDYEVIPVDVTITYTPVTL